MENLESRGGQESFLPEDMRAGMVDQGQTMMMERRLLEGYRFVDVLLTGGAPWGFTLKGGKEHGELLIITKVEEGSKAGEILMAGDEIVNINDIPLSGYRQEAICLVKGSHKTLKMVVKRKRQVMVNIITKTMPSDKDLLVARSFLMNILRSSMRKNDITYRPHSWHSTKFIENPMETLTAQLASTNFNPTWGNRYHSSSSSHDLTNSWDQSNLHRTSEHFSSVGSMDSIDQTYQFGRLSSAKSNNSIDNIGNHSKRDSAYGSFSTSFITPDHALSKSGSVSTENILYKINEWDNTKQGPTKTGQFVHESKGAEDKQGYQSPSTFYERNKSPRVDDNGETKHSGRSSFGPVWHVPDKKKTSSSPPPPPPPLRSDSYAITKTHEKPHTHSELTSTQHFNVANKSHSRVDWSSDLPGYQQRHIIGPDRNVVDVRQISNSSYQSEINLDQIGSYQDKYHNVAPHSNRLQLSQSTTDVRFAQPSYNYHHQRQYSDESTLFQNSRASASIKAQPQQVTFYSGTHELMVDPAHAYGSHQRRSSSNSESNIGLKVKGNGNGQSRVTGTKLPPQGSITQHPYREEFSKVDVSDRRSISQDNTALKTTYSLPQQNNPPSPENCEKYSPKMSGKKDCHSGSNERIKPRKSSDYYEEQYDSHNFSQHDQANRAISSNKYRSHQKDYSWNEEEESKITPQITPMLHSLAQEGRNRSVSSPDTNEKQLFTEASKQSRRSDRFATTLRNEIQQRRARLQKSKSTAALTESNEGEDAENWNQDSLESVTPSSDGSFSNTYKNHLKEAQARVLRATSFKRRDLEPSFVDPTLSPERRSQGYSISKPVFPQEATSYQFDNSQPKQSTATSNSQNITRIGGRKRFTTQQKLKSYSEPEKMNEVGIYEDNLQFQSRDATQGAVGSFADRWKFFEETSKSTPPQAAPKPPPLSVTEVNVKYETHNVKDNEKESDESWHQKRSRAASLGFEHLPKDRSHKDEFHHGVSYKSTDNIIPHQPSRLGTFAEYQASWKEQKKPLERKNSGRCHSADNILDTDFDQSQKSQYMHERSRSSPTTDFCTQGAVVESSKQTSVEGENAESAGSIDCSNAGGGSSVRIIEIEDKGDLVPIDETISYENNRKVPNESSEVPDTLNVPQKSRARSGTLPSDYRFVNENVRLKGIDLSFSAVPISETHSSHPREEHRREDPVLVNKKRGPAPQRPPPPKLDKYWRQSGSTSSLATSTESLLTPSHGKSASYSPGSADVVKPQATPVHSPGGPSDKHLNVLLPNPRLSQSSENVSQNLDKKDNSTETEVSTKPCYLQKPGMEPSRSPSPQFAPQKLTDKPPLLVQDESLARFERVIDNTTVKMVPIKIVHSESHAEKESRNNLLSAIEPPALPTGLTKDQIKTLSTSEQSYSRFCAYTRQDHDPEDQYRATNSQSVQDFVENSSPDLSLIPGNSKGKDLIYADLKSEELVREIVGKDKSLADILDPNAKMMTTMDLMEGIFRKDENLLEEAQQRRKVHPKVPSPRPPEEKKEDLSKTAAISLTTSSTYYSTSAPKAELLIKMKDMQEQQHNEESSEDEMDHNLFEKKQELIDSISKKLQVLREARETLLEDIQCNNALGEEVEIIVKEVCKTNEFDKFRMFIGDLEKIVNLLLSLSGRLARVENALNNLDENASPEERRTLVEKRKFLTNQHEDAKELKENLDRRERTVFDILASYLNEENLADYEHFVKMKSALILEQRELEDKIKLGEEQLKCLTDSLPPDRTK
ncbi:protein Shroom2 isoform 2-T2 [Anomaloglossus baeobatrachus]|uniref:protein Shroom2 isoform X2 n=1 Tax=Anomaloglossus baeobatrachus TaxID=238106 RepID=UPI003F4F7068